ncbi:TPA: hypothetical protein ACIKU7_004982, partial [Escherichia coli]
LYTVVCSCQQINTDSGYQYLSLHRLLIFRSLILCSRGLLATTHPAEMKNITRLKNRIEAFAIMTLNIV